MRPVLLVANQPRHVYRGGENIARFRGIDPIDDHRPEDWVGSTTTRFGASSDGLTVLPDGRALRTAVAEDPIAWLGPAHAQRWGATPALLVKLLDAGQRLPVHCHPTRRFARDHLHSPFGKTEAWVVLGTPEDRPGQVYLGFRQDVPEELVRTWTAAQDRSALLSATNQVEVSPGDAVLVPAGLPHAIDPGLFLVELQEPTDFSVLLEWEGFAADRGESAHLRLGWNLALESVERRAWSPEAVAGLIRHPPRAPAVRPGVRPVFPEAADPYFRAEHIGAGATMEASFAVIVVVRGEGRFESASGGGLPLRAGQTLLVPYSGGESTVDGDIVALRCLPPSPDTTIDD